MTIPRLVVVLGLILAAMLAIVVLRADNTRLHYEMSKLDRRAELVQREIYDRQLELARLKSPTLIWARATELQTRGIGPAGKVTDVPGVAVKKSERAAPRGASAVPSKKSAPPKAGAAKSDNAKSKRTTRKP